MKSNSFLRGGFPNDHKWVRGHRKGSKYDHAIYEWPLICGMFKKLNSMTRRKVVPITGQNIMIVIDLI